MGARMMSGHTSSHEKFEEMAARFVHKEDAYLLNFGYQGMVSIIDALVDRHDVIVYDSESHACIMDGCDFNMERDLYSHITIWRSCENSYSELKKLQKNQVEAFLLLLKESLAWQVILVSSIK